MRKVYKSLALNFAHHFVTDLDDFKFFKFLDFEIPCIFGRVVSKIECQGFACLLHTLIHEHITTALGRLLECHGQGLLFLIILSRSH